MTSQTTHLELSGDGVLNFLLNPHFDPNQSDFVPWEHGGPQMSNHATNDACWELAIRGMPRGDKRVL